MLLFLYTSKICLFCRKLVLSSSSAINNYIANSKARAAHFNACIIFTAINNENKMSRYAYSTNFVHRVIKRLFGA